MIFLCLALNDGQKEAQWINNQNNAEHWEDHCWKCRWMFLQPGNLWSVQLASQLKKIKQWYMIWLTNISFGCYLEECWSMFLGLFASSFRYVCFWSRELLPYFVWSRHRKRHSLGSGQDISGCRLSLRGTAWKQQGVKAKCTWQSFVFPPLPSQQKFRLCSQQDLSGKHLCWIYSSYKNLLLECEMFLWQGLVWLLSRERKHSRSICWEPQFYRVWSPLWL